MFHPWKTRDFRSKISRFGNSEWEQTSDLGNENHVFSMCETNEILGNEKTKLTLNYHHSEFPKREIVERKSRVFHG